MDSTTERRDSATPAREGKVRSLVRWSRLSFAVALATTPLAGVLIASIFGGAEAGGVVGLAVLLLSLIVESAVQSSHLSRLGWRDPYPQEVACLAPIAEELAASAGIATPALRIIDSAAVNAFSAALSDGTIVGVTSGAPALLEPRELRAVVTHETAHLQHRDTFFLGWHVSAVSVLTFLITAATVVGVVMARAAGRGRHRKGSDGIAFLSLVLIFAGAIAYLVGVLLSKVFSMASSRQSEFAADERGAMLSVDGFALASALAKMSLQAQAVAERNTPATTLFIVDLATRAGVAGDVFATHPARVRCRFVAETRSSSKLLGPLAA